MEKKKVSVPDPGGGEHQSYWGERGCAKRNWVGGGQKTPPSVGKKKPEELQVGRGIALFTARQGSGAEAEITIK